MVRPAALFALVLLAAHPAAAHTLGAAGAGLGHGFAHPFAGLDHLVAMVALGLWAAQTGGRARLLYPLAFLAAMAAGGALEALGIALPGVEAGILASLIVLGGLVAMAARVPQAAALIGIAVLALFHGHAHGAELPAAADALAYGLGFVAATALLHGIGIGAAVLAERGGVPLAARAAGAAIVVLGASLALGV